VPGGAAPASAPKQKRRARGAFVSARAARGARHALEVLQDLNVPLTDVQAKPRRGFLSLPDGGGGQGFRPHRRFCRHVFGLGRAKGEKSNY